MFEERGIPTCIPAWRASRLAAVIKNAVLIAVVAVMAQRGLALTGPAA